MSLLKKMQAARGATPTAPAPKPEPARVAKLAMAQANRDERFESPYAKNAVRNSEDLERILALPRRPVPDEETLERMRVTMTARLANGIPRGQGCKCHELNPAMYDGTPGSACITELRDIQAWYLYEAAEVQGALGPIAVGSGKTGIDILTAMVVPGCREAVLLIPPGLKAQFLADYRLWAQHFDVPNIAGGPGAGPNGEYVSVRDGQRRPVLHVLKYSELSSAGFATWFKARPNITVIIADEAQALKDRNATRVKRFLAHFLDQPETRFFCHTGSLTSKGLEDYSHLSALALREGSPVPIEPHVVTAWGEALNPPRHGLPAPPGALMSLCEERWNADGTSYRETVQQGFARRFIETRGVVATFEGSLTGVALVIRERKPPSMPAEVKEALQRVRTKMIRPDGEELQDALEVAATARQVACGFYMYWNFPGAKAEDFATGGRIDQWFAKRQAWNREVRARLEHHTPEMDSEGLLKAAARRYYGGYRGDKPMWASKAWPDWEAVERTVPHETRTKWISDWLARDAAAWVAETEAAGRPGIVWTQNPEMGRLIAKLADRPYYGAGDEAAIAIRAEKGTRSVVASIPAHHRGRNLQAFSANLVVQPPSDAGVFEQLLGRTHRSLQKRSEVVVDVYLHVAELKDAFDVAVRRARYVKDTTLSDQKLLAAAERNGAGAVGPLLTLSITRDSSKS